MKGLTRNFMKFEYMTFIHFCYFVFRYCLAFLAYTPNPLLIVHSTIIC